ncbi:hypothetical protein I6F35_35410 [Bradyrhizobium sp. BRP22]|uniref:hypothetical protein n=1 Tax=Bradyrhizobium sp. BRP22 TaxID=2793821 RepID=UPI001CD5096C|nr:hypothetical protein [Bradyrhizobium sp. BRP22]MCA1458406.1 hypothetical protein [Bradyrhizobium sp. BRP22]
MITPVRRTWSPKELFGALTLAMFTAEPSVVRARCNKLWPELYTEYDARYLKKGVVRPRLILTEDAAAFFDAWAADAERPPRALSGLWSSSLMDPKDIFGRDWALDFTISVQSTNTSKRNSLDGYSRV